MGAPGWLSRLIVRLQLRSRSRGPWVRAPHPALGRWLRAWSLLPILCLPLSLPLPVHALSLPVSKNLLFNKNLLCKSVEQYLSVSYFTLPLLKVLWKQDPTLPSLLSNTLCRITSIKVISTGTWVAQLVKRPTSAQVMISQLVGLSPAKGSEL